MVTLIQQFIGDGETKSFGLLFPFITTKDIRATVGLKSERNWTLDASGSSITFEVAPALGVLVEIERHTSSIPVVAFYGPAIQRTADLVKSFTQTLHVAEEARNFVDGAILFSPALNAYTANRKRITNVGLAIKPDDFVTLAYIRSRIVQDIGALPSQADVDAAIAAIQAVIIGYQDDIADVHSQLPVIDLAISNMAATLAILRGLYANPPPDGAAIVSRLDAAIGNADWRYIQDDSLGTTVLDTNGTWTKPDPETTAYKYALVEAWGGGAAGMDFNPAVNIVQTGDGPAPSQPSGAGGGYNRRFYTLSALPDTPIPVVVGQGGDPNGTKDGGASSFNGTDLVAPGGKAPSTPYLGGDGGSLVKQPLPDGRISGKGGAFPSYSSYKTPSTRGAPGINYTGAGGAPGQESAAYRACDGADAEWGGASGGAGATIRPKSSAAANQPTYLISRVGSPIPGAGTTYPDLKLKQVYPNGVFTSYVYNYYGTASPTTQPWYNTYLSYSALSTPPTDLAASYIVQGIGGKSQRGGNGGDGGAPGKPGTDGSKPGGGGGGAGAPSQGWTSAARIPGGKGAPGRVKISLF